MSSLQRSFGLFVASAALLAPAVSADTVRATAISQMTENPAMATDRAELDYRAYPVAKSNQRAEDQAPAEWVARFVRPCAKSGKRVVC